MSPLKTKIMDYCLSKDHTSEHFPFDNKTWVCKVYDKMFALTDILEDQVSFNLKCNPERAEELRAEYSCILPGYHMSKKHWNTVEYIPQEISWELMKELIDHSYELVLGSVPKKLRS